MRFHNSELMWKLLSSNEAKPCYSGCLRLREAHCDLGLALARAWPVWPSLFEGPPLLDDELELESDALELLLLDDEEEGLLGVAWMQHYGKSTGCTTA